MMDLINRTELLRHLDECIAMGNEHTPYTTATLTVVRCAVAQMPDVDAVPVSVIESWLTEIAFNNMKNYLSDASEEIISRLVGLLAYCEEIKEEAEKAFSDDSENVVLR